MNTGMSDCHGFGFSRPLLSLEGESNDLSEEEPEDYKDRIYLWRRAVMAEVFTQQCSREARIIVHEVQL